MKRLSAVVFVICLAMNWLGAEGSRDEGDDSGPVTISCGIWDDTFKPFMDEIITAFEERNPDIRVDLQIVPWGNYWDKLQTALTGEQAWDVFWINAPFFPVYAGYGVIADLSADYEAEGIDYGNFPPALVDLYRFDGISYTLPWFFDTVVFYYNKERFDEAGMAYPDSTWSLDDVRSAAERLTVSDEKWGIYVNPSSHSMWGMLLSNGGAVFTEDRMGIAYLQPESLEVWRKLYDMVSEGLSPTPALIQSSGGGSAMRGMLASGDIAMVNVGSWVYGNLRERMGDNLGVTLLPAAKAGRKSATITHGLAAAAYTKSRHPSAAKKFAVYMTSPEAQDIIARADSVMPSYKRALEVWVERFEYPDAAAVLSDTGAAFPYQVAKTGGLEWDFRAGDIIADTFSGNLSFDEGMQRAVNEADRIIQQN